MFSYIGRELLEYSSPALPKVQSSYVGQVRPLLALPRLLEAKTTSRERRGSCCMLCSQDLLNG